MNILMYYIKYLKERKQKMNFFLTNSFYHTNGQWLPKSDEDYKNDLIRKFISEFRKKVKRKLKVRIFTCVPELSMDGSFFYSDEKGEFLTFTIYLENVPPERIGLKKGVYIDNNHDIVKIFYKTLKRYRLPGIDKSTRIQFFITNYQDCYEGKICFSVEEELKKSARTHKELSVTTTNDGFVLGLEDEVYNQYINDEKYLKKYRNMIIKRVKKLDTENRIDLNKIVVYIEPLSVWHEKAWDQSRSGILLENVKKIEPTTDENEGRTMIDYNPVNEKGFYKSYMFLSKAMIILLIISLVMGSLVKLLFFGLLLPIYVIISIIFFFGYLKSSKIFSIVLVALLLLFSISNYKYILDTKIFFEGGGVTEIGIWEELSNDSYDYIMIKSKPVRNYYTVGKINDKVFKIKEKLINGKKYKIRYLPNTNIILGVTLLNNQNMNDNE